ncbi:site-2 protease family protein [Candidatus Saccharibacteria bacterium]|nr:site-2 protease family protein [Candidatus Saccharibacteria bacterium]
MQIAISVLGFILFVGLVLVHEWGHYIVARRNGVKVEEFGLGFPPRAWGKKRKDGMILSLNWLPLGGFVKLKGEHDSDTSKGSFGAASTWAKSKIMLAGVTMNLIAGLVLLTILAAVGIPKILTTDAVGQDQFTVKSDTKIVRQEVRAGYVDPGSPASKIGLNSLDVIQKISNSSQTRAVSTTEQLHDATTYFGGQTVTVTYKHKGQVVQKNVALLSKAEVEASSKTNNPKGYLGVVPTNLTLQRSTWSAPIVAVGLTKQLVVLTFQGLGHALSGLGSLIAGGLTGNHTARSNGQEQATSQVGGPVAIVAVLWDGGSLGLSFVLMVIAIISLTLALMNVLPIPALDGGRLFVMWLSRLFKHPLSAAAEERIHGTGMAVLLTLFALITIVDVRRFF